jgi:hypothetical protein
MATKYKEYFDRMRQVNKEAFDNFKILHDKYALNPNELQEKFNKEGEKILNILREWENKLCMQSEKAGYGSYTSNLAEKFQEEVRKHFPEIVNIGLKVQEDTFTKAEDFFRIKKINLS